MLARDLSPINLSLAIFIVMRARSRISSAWLQSGRGTVKLFQPLCSIDFAPSFTHERVDLENILVSLLQVIGVAIDEKKWLLTGVRHRGNIIVSFAVI